MASKSRPLSDELPPMVIEAQLYCDHEFEVMVLGDKGVGKTSFVKRFVLEGIRKYQSSILGLEFSTRIWEKNNEFLRVKLWDTPHTLCERNTLPNVFHRAVAFVLLYDITKKETFSQLLYYLDEIKAHNRFRALCFVVGTKLDLQDSRQVNAESVDRFCQVQNLPAGFEVSSASGEGIEETFSCILQHLDSQPRRQSNALDLVAEPVLPIEDSCYLYLKRKIFRLS